MASMRALAKALSVETGLPLETCRSRLRRGAAAESIREDVRDDIRPPASIEQKRRWIVAQKCRPCVDCKRTYPPACMDFHHRDPAMKRFNMASWATKSMNAIVREAEKCDLLCANCHRARHSIEFC